MKIQAAVLLLSAALPLHAADACETVTAATAKIWEVPVHIYITETAAYTKNQPKNSESIYTGGPNGAIYVFVGGKWNHSPTTTGEVKAARDKARAEDKDAVKPTCRYLRDEAVNGEPAAVYSSSQNSPDTKVEATLWISKSRNLPLRTESDMDVGGAAGKSHYSTRYDYTNVHPPPGVK